ncbi:hypothetical protein MNBD_GAMMA21-128 [hydrothermal vent metagenome]|uniref:CopZ zinc binding domain-containing protein n=1 Tax=hydrothermal vent metagenome TaxID=652676 RepID=A0A3B1AKF3_9ZZZZ
MSDCCNVDSEANQNVRSKTVNSICPVCGQRSKSVSLKTVLHHVKQVWASKLSDQQYYFCHTPECNVVYFAAATSIITKSEIRSLIGSQEQSADALVCFCFGVSKAEAANNKDIKAFVITQTKASLCSCATANPSGRCCLKDFPKTT